MNKLPYYDSRTFLAYHLGGYIKDYQIDEDNNVYYKGVNIGNFKTIINNTNDSVSIDSVFYPKLRPKYIEIKCGVVL